MGVPVPLIYYKLLGNKLESILSSLEHDYNAPKGT